MLVWEEVGPISELYAKLYRPDIPVVYLKPGAEVEKLGTWLEPAGTGASEDIPPAPLAEPASGSD